MASKLEPNSLGDWLKWEQDSDYSREKVTVLSGENLATGQVVGIVTVSGKIVALDQDAVDGSQAAAGIMVGAIDASLADAEGVIIEKDALVAMDNLVWPADIEAAEKTTAIGQLEALGIKAVGLA